MLWTSERTLSVMWEGHTVYKLAICDDDIDFAASLKSFLYGFFRDRETDCSVDVFDNVLTLDSAVDSGAEYDLVILDILFENGNGMDYAKRLRARKCKFDIIFISSCREYAIESYDADSLYYILKPANPEKLTAALNRFLQKHAPVYINLNTTRGLIKVDLSDILYFEIYGHRLSLCKRDGTNEELRSTLKEMEEKLPTEMFIRPHRSYLVNVNCITEIAHYNIKITNGEIIPISRAQYNKVQLEFLDYLDKTDII